MDHDVSDSCWQDRLSRNADSLTLDQTFNYLLAHAIQPLPNMQLKDWRQEMDRIATLSLTWKPRPLFADYGNAGIVSDEESVEGMLSRQRAMSLLKANQTPRTPRIYPFIGMQHFYFGSLNGVVSSSQPLLQTKGILCFNSLEGGVEIEHSLFDLERRFFPRARAPRRRFKFETLLRWFPAVNLHLEVRGGRKLSFICFLFYQDVLHRGSFQFVVTPTVMDRIFHASFGKYSQVGHLFVSRHSGVLDDELEKLYLDIERGCYPTTARELPPNGYLPNTCILCSWFQHEHRRPRWDAALPTAYLAGHGLQFCIHPPPGPILCLNSVDQILTRFGLSGPFQVSSMQKSRLPNKLKLYFAIIQLGGMLALNTDSTSSENQEPDTNGGSKDLMTVGQLPRAKEKDFPIDPANHVLFMQRGKRPEPTDAKYDFAFASCRCHHLFSPSWASTPFRDHPQITNDFVLAPDGRIFGGYDVHKTSSGFHLLHRPLPPRVRGVQTAHEIRAAHEADLIPLIKRKRFDDHAFAVRAAVYAMGGHCYYLRECVECAVARVEVLRRALGLVVILAPSCPDGIVDCNGNEEQRT